MATAAAHPAASAADEQQRRAHELMDAARGHFRRWLDRTLEECSAAASDQKKAGGARDLLFYALNHAHVSHRAAIYRCWIAIELRHGDAAAARVLYGEWHDHGDGRADADFWCRYIEFEDRDGGHWADGSTAAVREVAEAALEACPRDAAVYAAYAKMELRRGHGRRAAAVVSRGLDALASDDHAAREWLQDEVQVFRDAMRARSLAGRLRRFFAGGIRRSPREYDYERHHSGHDHDD